MKALYLMVGISWVCIIYSLNSRFRSGKLVQMRDVGWMTGDEFWIGDDLKVAPSTREQYSRFYGNKNVSNCIIPFFE